MENNYKVIEIDYHLFRAFFHFLLCQNNWYFRFDSKKNKLSIGIDREEIIMECRLPLIFPSCYDHEDLPEYVQKVDRVSLNYIILLIQSGICSLGYFENGELGDHHVIRKYTVRKKQGKAQITYLKKKGKSRYGSRIRLANTVQFFNEINRELNTLFEEKIVNQILYNCAPYSWGMLFRSKIKCPFNKNDLRLKRIPVYVNIPNFKQLLYINKRILTGTLKIIEKNYNDILDLVKL